MQTRFYVNSKVMKSTESFLGIEASLDDPVFQSVSINVLRINERCKFLIGSIMGKKRTQRNSNKTKGKRKKVKRSNELLNHFFSVKTTITISRQMKVAK